jgi:hypothetical protein
MRRIKLILAMAAVLVGTLALQAGPAMADDLDCRDARGDLIRCDGDLYEPYNNNDYYFDDDYYYYSFNPYFFNPYFFSPYYYFDDDSYGCEGPVCLID